MTNDKDIRESVKKRLIQCRTEKGLTQAEVGKIVGKSPTAVASWEQGISLPDLNTFFKLSNLYDKTVTYMYGLDYVDEHEERLNNSLHYQNSMSEQAQFVGEREQLLEDFAKLTHDQQLTVLALLHSMIPSGDKDEK